jgi:hypothetical protein
MRDPFVANSLINRSTARSRQQLRVNRAVRAGPARDLAGGDFGGIRGQHVGVGVDAATDAAECRCDRTTIVGQGGDVLRGLEAVAASLRDICWQCVLGRNVLGNGCLASVSGNNTFRDLRALDVVLVSRQRDGGQDGDDRNYDHQFDEGKALCLLHGVFLVEKK